MNTENDPQTGTQPPQASPRKSGKLEQPGTRRRLIHTLARADRPIRQVAREFNCDESSVREFRDRHTDEIAAVTEDIDNEFAGLWIAQKQERLDVLTDLFRAADTGDLDGIKVQIDILRKAAEELGQIPNRTTVKVDGGMRIELVGVDPDTLT